MYRNTYMVKLEHIEENDRCAKWSKSTFFLQVGR